MKTTYFIFFLLCTASVWSSAQATPEYAVAVHVTASRMVRHGDSVGLYQYLSATIEGKKYELESQGIIARLLKIGDYKARLVTDERGKGENDLWQVYEFQLPEQKTRKFLVVGQLE